MSQPSALRNILPKPPGEVRGSGAGAPIYNSGRTRTKRTSTGVSACHACRARRSKCDGRIPSCDTCIRKATTCEYDSPADADTILASLAADNAAMMAALSYLQRAPADQAWALVEHLRADTDALVVGEAVDVASLTRWVRARQAPVQNGGSDDGRVGADALALADSESSDLVRARHFRNALRMSLSMLRAKGARDLSNASFLQAATPAASTMLEGQTWTQKVTLANLLATIDLFFSYNEEMGPLVRQEHAKTSVHGIIELEKRPHDMSVEDFFNERNQTREDAANLAEVFGMAAVGARYHRKGNLTQRVPEQVARHFYELSRQMLDATIEHDPLRAMKVCLLLTTYNVILKPTVAIGYTELGIALGRLHEVQTQVCPPTLDPEEFKEHKRTWRSLLLTASWLGVSIGLARTDTTNLSILDQERHLDVEDIIQREHAKIAIIKADIMHMLPSHVTADTAVINDIQLRLQLFHSELPPWLTIGSVRDGDQSNVLKRMIMYLHLFFLSAMQLLHRKIVSNSDYLSTPTRSSPVTMAALREGLMAAKITARIIRLMHHDSPVENICWIFSTYISAIIILHAAAHKTLSLFTPSHAAPDLALVAGCIETLSHCANRDKVAADFMRTLAAYLAVVRDAVYATRGAGAHFNSGSGGGAEDGDEDGYGWERGTNGMNDGDDTVMHTPTSSASPTTNNTATSAASANDATPTDSLDEGASVEYLLYEHAGSSPLHKAARDLRYIIAKPFSGELEHIPEGGPPGPQLQTSLVNWPEAMMGTSQEWTWDVNGCSPREGEGGLEQVGRDG